MERDLPSAGFIPKCPQQLGLGRAKARGKTPSLLSQVRSQGSLAVRCCLPARVLGAVRPDTPTRDWPSCQLPPCLCVTRPGIPSWVCPLNIQYSCTFWEICQPPAAAWHITCKQDSGMTHCFPPTSPVSSADARQPHSCSPLWLHGNVHRVTVTDVQGGRDGNTGLHWLTDTRWPLWIGRSLFTPCVVGRRSTAVPLTRPAPGGSSKR